MKSRCIRARMTSRRTVSGSLLTLLRACHEHHAVHMTEPMIIAGFSVRTLSMALARLAGTSKSHGMPSSGSKHVRSSANPGIRSHPGIDEIALVTRAGEYISDTTLLEAARLSRRYGPGDAPIDDMRLMYSAPPKAPMNPRSTCSVVVLLVQCL